MAAPSRSRLFVFGLGYSARVVAARFKAGGGAVAGTCRGEAGAGALAAEGFEAVRFTREHPLADLGLLAQATHLLSSVPPDADGDPVIDRHFFDIARSERVEWVGYLSSTSVYGDRAGAWVDEGDEPAPSSARGRARLAAEKRWLDLWQGFGVPVHIFRLAGIYGPGRSVLERLAAGEAQRIVKPGHVFSRIHVDDIARSLEASMARPNPGAVYNVCDDEPASSEALVGFASSLLGCAPPPAVAFEEAALTERGRDFYADNRRVSNRRLRRELRVDLAYPDYRAGLRALAGIAD